MPIKRGTKSNPDMCSADGAVAVPDATALRRTATAILSCQRRPRQERGERRVSAILDAAAELIGETGPGGLTVQALADRAETSKGSLYHFFPDLPSVLRALADRHAAAIGDLTRALMADPAVDWSALTVTETVTRLIAPLAYLEANPDLLALARLPLLGDEKTRRLAPICDLADHILRHRYPGLPSQARTSRASTMVAVLDGVVSYSLRSVDVDAHDMVIELSAVLAGYLTALDAGFVPA
jgi:AcrR family transcriptional regulator